MSQICVAFFRFIFCSVTRKYKGVAHNQGVQRNMVLVVNIFVF